MQDKVIYAKNAAVGDTVINRWNGQYMRIDKIERDGSFFKLHCTRISDGRPECLEGHSNSHVWLVRRGEPTQAEHIQDVQMMLVVARARLADVDREIAGLQRQRELLVSQIENMEQHSDKGESAAV